MTLVLVVSAPALYAAEEQVHVFAAASLTDAMTEAAGAFEQETRARVYLNFAGSNTLRIQIENGAPCDIYLSANEDNVKRLVHQKRVLSQDVMMVLPNSLAVITQKDNPVNLKDLDEFEEKVFDYFALADPDTVPAGIYAKEAIRTAGHWDTLENKVLPALDVRAALAQVENGNVQFGIVYRTDARISDKVRVVFEIPQQYYSPIRYPVCIMKESRDKASAKEFFHFVVSQRGRAIFKKYGFDLYSD